MELVGFRTGLASVVHRAHKGLGFSDRGAREKGADS